MYVPSPTDRKARMELLDLTAEIIRAHEHAPLGSQPELCEVRTFLVEAGAEKVCWAERVCWVERVCCAEVLLRGERGLCTFWP
jgi:hypothetical protein